MILSVQNISKAFGINQILSDVSFHIEEKEKIAIVGINGSGKTTLLKIIMGNESADEGQVVVAKDTSIGYLSQHQDISFDNTIYAEMLETKRYLIDMEEKIRSLEKDMKHADGEELEKIMNTYNNLSSQYDRENGYAYKSEVTGVLKGLGFSEADYERHINTLSGGQRMRVALGKLLLSKPDIIILDEPTNHLDMLSIAWLEGFLSAYQGSVIIVSHDRYFIDKIATKVIEIDNTKAIIYHGNYSYYSKKRAEIRASQMKAYLNQQQEIKHQEAVIEKLKQFNREKSIKRAESREKMLDKIDRLDKPTEVNADMKLSLTPSVESG
ncbi:MAG: ABC-F family ATP-binding cassette domain-containing protein, partial [Lachnospiraceae bacterium]|nr:ABC-F family ATP-binding cassette domain-containing protein [Lachnospiraceae bacterium]